MFYVYHNAKFNVDYKIALTAVAQPEGAGGHDPQSRKIRIVGNGVPVS